MSKPANNARARGSKPGTLKRLVNMLFSFYPVLLPLVMLGVVPVSYTHLDVYKRQHRGRYRCAQARPRGS